ncbi:hypothetical protein BJ508DRAFT_372815 [Ascobolus immersus RN42]|uniref:Uncharacterized protein n=1 Tax=Ascobolus immersus RN42 TaxID=1160509 RepID=A0A3N4IL15_ASCIM|nr:hypothetical protein BJ508DRAFT_372815 [Ascobolus immersus RN42]
MTTTLTNQPAPPASSLQLGLSPPQYKGFFKLPYDIVHKLLYEEGLASNSRDMFSLLLVSRQMYNSMIPHYMNEVLSLDLVVYPDSQNGGFMHNPNFRHEILYAAFLKSQIRDGYAPPFRFDRLNRVRQLRIRLVPEYANRPKAATFRSRRRFILAEIEKVYGELNPEKALKKLVKRKPFIKVTLPDNPKKSSRDGVHAELKTGKPPPRRKSTWHPQPIVPVNVSIWSDFLSELGHEFKYVYLGTRRHREDEDEDGDEYGETEKYKYNYEDEYIYRLFVERIVCGSYHMMAALPRDLRGASSLLAQFSPRNRVSTSKLPTGGLTMNDLTYFTCKKLLGATRKEEGDSCATPTYTSPWPVSFGKRPAGMKMYPFITRLHLSGLMLRFQVDTFKFKKFEVPGSIPPYGPMRENTPPRSFRGLNFTAYLMGNLSLLKHLKITKCTLLPPYPPGTTTEDEPDLPERVKPRAERSAYGYSKTSDDPTRIWPTTTDWQDVAARPSWLRDVFDPVLFHYWAKNVGKMFKGAEYHVKYHATSWHRHNRRPYNPSSEFVPLQLETCVLEDLHDGYHVEGEGEQECVSDVALRQYANALLHTESWGRDETILEMAKETKGNISMAFHEDYVGLAEVAERGGGVLSKRIQPREDLAATDRWDWKLVEKEEEFSIDERMHLLKGTDESFISAELSRQEGWVNAIEEEEKVSRQRDWAGEIGEEDYEDGVEEVDYEDGVEEVDYEDGVEEVDYENGVEEADWANGTVGW